MPITPSSPSSWTPRPRGFPLRRFLPRFAALVFGCVALLPVTLPAADDPARTAMAVEALLKLQNPDLTANAKLKEAVLRILDQSRGTPGFVALVRKFKIEGQEAGLLEVATRPGSAEAGADAARLLVAAGKEGLIRQTLGGTNTVAAAELLASLAGEGRAVPWVVELVGDAGRDAALRRKAIGVAVRHQEGATALVRMASEGTLPEDMKFTAQSQLASVRWPDIKAAAAKVLPPPPVSGGEPLPPVPELVKRSGDAGRGRLLYFGKATCATCHQVAGQGVNFGPELSQIGTKLGRDALYEAILDPSAGISFGFEAWLITLKGDEEAFGLIVSETETEVSIKAPGGIVSSYPKGSIIKREKQLLSAMPAGLQATMTPQELVDLVEFLASLRKP